MLVSNIHLALCMTVPLSGLYANEVSWWNVRWAVEDPQEVVPEQANAIQSNSATLKLAQLQRELYCAVLHPVDAWSRRWATCIQGLIPNGYLSRSISSGTHTHTPTKPNTLVHHTHTTKEACSDLNCCNGWLNNVSLQQYKLMFLMLVLCVLSLTYVITITATEQ